MDDNFFSDFDSDLSDEEDEAHAAASAASLRRLLVGPNSAPPVESPPSAAVQCAVDPDPESPQFKLHVQCSLVAPSTAVVAAAVTHLWSACCAHLVVRSPILSSCFRDTKIDSTQDAFFWCFFLNCISILYYMFSPA